MDLAGERGGVSGGVGQDGKERWVVTDPEMKPRKDRSTVTNTITYT